MPVEVAKTILQQLGGNRFCLMSGARNLVGDDSTHSLRFRLPLGLAKNGINYIRITLNDTDLYDVTFSRFRNAGFITDIAQFHDVYAENLVGIFCEQTGLEVQL